MKKMKRYNIGGGMGDSNEGMKDAYDARIADEAKAAADETKAIADEAKAAEKMKLDAERMKLVAENEGNNISEGERVSSIAPSKKQAPSKPRVVASTMPKAVLKDSGAYRGMRSDTKAEPALVDETKLSVNERIKRNFEKNLGSARSGSGPTDTRSVNERIRSGLRSVFGMKKGGAAKKMASGGSTSSASKRADGIASKGKTRGKMC